MEQRLLDGPPQPLRLFRNLEATHDACFLLESAEGPQRLARYSFLGADPAGVVRSQRGNLEVEGDLPAPREHEAPLDYLQRVIDDHGVEDHGPRFRGGLVGYAGYELVTDLETVPRHEDDAPFPDLEFGLYLDGVVVDHVEGTTTYFTHTGEDRSDLFQELAGQDPPSTSLRVGEPQETTDPKTFMENVQEAKRNIRDGEVFQVVLSRATQFQLEGDLSAYYAALRELNPSPYMYHVRFGDREIVGASPEMLVRVEAGEVETFPIAGTRPLGESEAERRKLAEDLLSDPKERAEHAMLVDLARNDVGRVAETGTVEVPEMMEVERYSHVQHLVSRVTGDLRKDLGALDALAALFPAGTVSGAPKVRAMELIHTLEPHARGPYAGCVGYVSLNGNLDTAITIRTLTRAGTTATVQAGAGIVADSDPRTEHEETRSKQAALLDLAERIRREGAP